MNIHDSIVIVVHDMAYGPPQALRDYLIGKHASRMAFFGLPFYTQKKATFVEYQNGTVTSKRSSQRAVSEGVIAYIRDIYLVLGWLVGRERYSVYVGADVLLCFAGLILRVFGKTEHVVLYTMDFSPVRFSNPFLNWLYHRIEIYCVRYADEVWNVSPRMAVGRERFLGLSKKKYPQRHVPVGIWNDKIKKVPLEKVKRHKIVFIGHLLKKQGVQLILESLPIVIKKVPNVEFLVIGGGPYERVLKQQARTLGLEKRVTFAGWIRDPATIFRLSGDAGAAVATYAPEKERMVNFSYYGDPGKLKNYLGAGIPVVLTDISYNARLLARLGCGVLVTYDAQDVARGLLRLLTREKTYIQFRKRAFAYAQTVDWRIVFGALFSTR